MATGQQIAQAGYKYLNTPYSVMDCQAFVEKCLADCGVWKDLKGSNAWYRLARSNGWVGTPEECKKKFGSIPAGAFLFIWKNDGGEVKRGYKDGLGNADHIGIYTATGKGAINSSYTNQCVCESKFSGKTINGGWNCVGLWNAIDYGQAVNNILTGGKSSGDGGGKTMTETSYPAKVIGGGLNLRAEQSTDSKRLIQIPDGTAVTVTAEDGIWAKVSYGSKTGWALKRYLQETEETVTVSKKTLESIYDTIGDWLGLRG